MKINESANLEPVSMFTITAKLVNHVSQSIVESFGSVGQTAIQQGIERLLEEQKNEAKEITGNSDYVLNDEALFTLDQLTDSEKVEQTFEAYKKVQENAGREAHTMFAMMAKIFAHITKAVVDQFGEKGQDAVRLGVGSFGEERGRDIARRAAAVGEPNTMDHYLSNYDMGRSELFEYETIFHPTEIEQTFTKCAFAEQWKKDGMGEYGILYCEMIDPSIAKGFNPNFEVIHDQYVLKEGTCHFRFQMKENEEKHD